jgi:APA family basic amino acid/polyamine antiporter
MEQKPQVTTYSTVTSRAAAAHPQPALRRALGLWGAVSIVVGTVIGSGIFLVPTRMIGLVGSVQTLFVVWIVAGVLSLFGALTYAELAAAMPEAGGEYVYLTEAYGPFWGFVYGWTQMWVAKSGSIATLAAGFYTYLTVFYPALGKPLVVLPYHIGPEGSLLEVHYGQLVAIVLILVLAGINYLGVEAGGALQVAVTVLKMLLIGGIIVIGLFSGKGDFSHLAQSIPAGTPGVAGFLLAMVSALWAYDGWNNVSMVASEIKEPHRNLPKALIFGTMAVIATYLLMNVAYFYVLSPERVSQSPRLAADLMTTIFGSAAGRAVTVAVLISILAALNGSILTGARVPYAMARGGLFFRSIAKVHPRFRTPGNSMVALCLWSCLVLLSGWYDQLYTFVIFGSWILYLMTAASVFVLRRKRPDLPRPYRVVGYPVVPVLFVLVALLLLANTLQKSPRESLMGLALMALGVPFYLYWKTGSKEAAPASILESKP